MKSTICLLTEWTLKASGLQKSDSMFLIKKGACVVATDFADNALLLSAIIGGKEVWQLAWRRLRKKKCISETHF